MFSRSILISGPSSNLKYVADFFAIKPQHLLTYSNPVENWKFLDQGENFGFYDEVAGAFCHSIDLTLNHPSEVEIDSMLLELSRRGILIAFPDESSSSPLDYILLKDGNQIEVEVREDLDSNLEIYPRPQRSGQ